MARWQLWIVIAIAAVFVLVTLISGEPVFLVPAAVLAVIAVGFALVHRRLGRHVVDRHGGSFEAAVADEREPIPSTPDIGDRIRPAGDTPEVHDEITPHDLPPDHPGRHEAERRAGGEGGTTRGDQAA